VRLLEAPYRCASFTVRHIGVAERAAARVWIGNWQRMLPVLVSARGLVTPSLLNAIERFVATPQPLLSVEREFRPVDPGEELFIDYLLAIDDAEDEGSRSICVCVCLCRVSSVDAGRGPAEAAQINGLQWTN
jgi:hypothetical protein